MTKCVVHQLSNGHTVSQPTTTSQIPAITAKITFLVV